MKIRITISTLLLAVTSIAPDAQLKASEGPEHAEELATAAATAGFTRIIAAGGDGTVHEVANGLLAAGNHGAVLGVWPLRAETRQSPRRGEDCVRRE